jgi:hypothetical protein
MLRAMEIPATHAPALIMPFKLCIEIILPLLYLAVLRFF